MRSLFSGNGLAAGNGNGNGKSNGHTASRWWSSLWGRGNEPDKHMIPYRRLALQLHYDLPRGQGLRSVLMVTPVTSNLVAYGSTALAFCLGEELRRPVLLIDVSPKNPEVSRIMDCAGSRGFADMARDSSARLEELVVQTTRENVWFLPVGTQRIGDRPTSAEELDALLKAVESRYDFVLLAGGSVLSDSSALALARYVGCVLLLVTENETRVEDLEVAQNVVASCKARKLGLVLTTPLRANGKAGSFAHEHSKAAASSGM
jgi:Mrp family chromosome partitioning ATPase